MPRRTTRASTKRTVRIGTRRAKTGARRGAHATASGARRTVSRSRRASAGSALGKAVARRVRETEHVLKRASRGVSRAGRRPAMRRRR